MFLLFLIVVVVVVFLLTTPKQIKVFNYVLIKVIKKKGRKNRKKSIYDKMRAFN